VNVTVDQSNRDGNLLAQAPSGSGKTLSIALGLLSNVVAGQGLQVVCICRTRELCFANWMYIRCIAEFTEIKVAIQISEAKAGLGIEEFCESSGA